MSVFRTSVVHISAAGILIIYVIYALMILKTNSMFNSITHSVLKVIVAHIVLICILKVPVPAAPSPSHHAPSPYICNKVANEEAASPGTKAECRVKRCVKY